MRVHLQEAASNNNESTLAVARTLGFDLLQEGLNVVLRRHHNQTVMMKGREDVIRRHLLHQRQRRETQCINLTEGCLEAIKRLGK